MTLLAMNQGDGLGDHKPITGPVVTALKLTTGISNVSP